ncbi:hypothetical protein SETIT_1G137100v2 [Setaria italica]|uniref:Uncharacterized protein n=2 Tax=Setaria TaxID=4554 RepID=A0A368PKB8_SETIT|nr:hypothetical protein SETIT_1G137100v2 [Setaria italica]TKW38749.1 hypothetical protein SEVIR_1G136500v2 [Setaria viridis]
MFKLGTQLICYPNNSHLGPSSRNWIIDISRTHADSAHITTRTGFRHRTMTSTSIFCFDASFHIILGISFFCFRNASSATWYDRILPPFNSNLNCTPDLSISVQTCP